MDDYLTLQAACRVIGISHPTGLKWVRSGKLPAEKRGREWAVPRTEAIRCREARDAEAGRVPWAADLLRQKIRHDMSAALAELYVEMKDAINAADEIERRFYAGADDPVAFQEIEETLLSSVARIHGLSDRVMDFLRLQVYAAATDAKELKAMPTRDELAELTALAEAFEADIKAGRLTEQQAAARHSELRIRKAQIYDEGRRDILIAEAARCFGASAEEIGDFEKIVPTLTDDEVNARLDDLLQQARDIAQSAQEAENR